jgi:hypothetical protein
MPMPPRLRPWTQAAFVAFVLAFGFLLAFRPNWDIDIFWHIAAGRWIVAHGRLPDTDIFTATDPTRWWASFQWLYQVLMHELDARTDFVWIRGLHAALFVATFALWIPVLQRIAPRRTLAAALVMLGIALSLDRLRVRPEAFNFLFLAIMLPWLLGLRDRPGRLPRARDLFAVALVSALWANLHAGGAALLPVAFAAIVAGRTIAWLADGRSRDSQEPLLQSLVLGAVSGLVMLPMPGFIEGLFSASAMYQVSAVLIPEWQPPVAYLFPHAAGPLTPHHLLCGIAPYLTLLVAGLAVIDHAIGLIRRRPPAGDLGLVALALLMAILGTRTARFLYLDLVALAALAWRYRDAVVRCTRPQAVRWAIPALAVLLAWVSYDQSVVRERHGLAAAVREMPLDQQPQAFPEQAADTLVAMGIEGRVFHLAAWGGYLLYRCHPDCRVFSDGRGNFSPRERNLMVLAHRNWERTEHIEALYREFPFDVLVFPPPVFPLQGWNADRWVRIHAGPDAEVFLRRSPENRENIARAQRFWRLMGLRFDGIDGFQAAHRRMTAARRLAMAPNPKRLEQAERMQSSNDPNARATAWFREGVVRFEAGAWEAAIPPLRQALSTGIRHTTAALYLVWALTLDGRADEAHATLVRHFSDPEILARPDHGPLNQPAARVLDLLIARLAPPQPTPEPPPAP